MLSAPSHTSLCLLRPKTRDSCLKLRKSTESYAIFFTLNLTPFGNSLIVRRLARDRPTIGVHEPFSFREVYRALSSPHVIIAFLMFFGNGLTVYAQALFLPSIVKQLGFSATRTQLLSVPPFAVAFVGPYSHHDGGIISRVIVLTENLFQCHWLAHTSPIISEHAPPPLFFSAFSL